VAGKGRARNHFGIIFAKESIMIIGGIYLKKVIKTNIIPLTAGKSCNRMFLCQRCLIDPGNSLCNL
jgi:hypothetical protein